MTNSAGNRNINGQHRTESGDFPVVFSKRVASAPARSQDTQIIANVPFLQEESLPVFKSTHLRIERNENRKVSIVDSAGYAYPLRINRETEILFASGERTSIVLTQSCTVMANNKFFVAISITDARGNLLLDEAIVDHIDPCISNVIDLTDSVRPLEVHEVSVALAGEKVWKVATAAGIMGELSEAEPKLAFVVGGQAQYLSLNNLNVARESGESVKKTILQANGKEISVLASERTDTGVALYNPPFHQPAFVFSV